jgi:hypothetical protein
MATTGYRRSLADADGQCCVLCTTGIDRFRHSLSEITGILSCLYPLDSNVYCWIPAYTSGCVPGGPAPIRKIYHYSLRDILRSANGRLIKLVTKMYLTLLKNPQLL